MKDGFEKKKRSLATFARIVKSGAESDRGSEQDGLHLYDFYDSDAESFDEFFSEVIAPYPSIQKYVESRYGIESESLVGIELGGPARKLFSEIGAQGNFRRTAGFVLHDGRNPKEARTDAENRHDVVEADVFFRQGVGDLSWRDVEEWTSQYGKADIAIQRMVQGVDLIREPKLYDMIVKRWMTQLAPGGTLLTEVPHRMSYEDRQLLMGILEGIEHSEIACNTDMTAVRIVHI